MFIVTGIVKDIDNNLSLEEQALFNTQKGAFAYARKLAKTIKENYAGSNHNVTYKVEDNLDFDQSLNIRDLSTYQEFSIVGYVNVHQLKAGD